MREIICAFCKSKQPRREENRFCIRCGRNLERKEVFLICCQKWYLDVDYCRNCPYCGKKTGMLTPELKEELRKKQEQKDKEEQKSIQEALHQLKDATVKTRSTGCKYHGSSEDMLSALYQDQVRGDLIIEDVLGELKKHRDNRAVVLSDRSEHLEIIHRSQFIEGKNVEVVSDGSSDKKLSDALDNFRNGTILLITLSKFMKSELRYMNRLFLASIFDLTESLIEKIGKTYKVPHQSPLMIFDYLDEDEEGYFNSLYQERIRFYRKEGAILEKLEG